MLSSLVRIVSNADAGQPESEDIFTSALGLVFTDDAQNFYGDPENLVAYHSRRFEKELLLSTADPVGETERRKFAHYVWNASLLMGELLGGKPANLQWKHDSNDRLGPDEWWLTEGEQETWNVGGRKVLELGAGL
jgi:EEF1A N-terminal glycine/lysine methyltransferase